MQPPVQGGTRLQDKRDAASGSGSSFWPFPKDRVQGDACCFPELGEVAGMFTADQGPFPPLATSDFYFLSMF